VAHFGINNYSINGSLIYYYKQPHIAQKNILKDEKRVTGPSS